jgi:hypothetical protein
MDGISRSKLMQFGRLDHVARVISCAGNLNSPRLLDITHLVKPCCCLPKPVHAWAALHVSVTSWIDMSQHGQQQASVQ